MSESAASKPRVREIVKEMELDAPVEEEYFDSLDKGWPFMLTGLRHDFGTPRRLRNLPETERHADPAANPGREKSA
jgi:hypothetical protein